MASTHKSLRSGTANKRPTTSIADGQIALNTNTTSPGLFFKDSTGATIIKVGPVHVGTTAPNASPAAGGSAGNSVGEIWLDTSLTPVGVKIWNGSAFVNATPIGSTTVQGLLELATNAETQTGTDPDRAVTPAGLQSKVSDSTSTTSSTTIASSTAVKSAYDLANAALPKSGGTVTGNLEIGTTGSLSFEGATADAFETTIAVVDPTADRTITLPDTTGTVVTTGDTGTVTSTMIADGTIVNGDINASAAIAGTKISPDFGSQTVQTTGIFSHALGTAGAPTVTFTGDTNTGIYSPGADQVAISTGGSGRLFVDASGNVGVGTSPSQLFHVAGASPVALLAASSGVGTLRLTRSTTTADLSVSTSLASLATTSATDLAFSTNNTERLRITSAGLVGVGTSSPGQLLSLKATGTETQLSLTSDTNQSAAIYLGDTDSVARGFIQYDNSVDALKIASAGSERIRIDSSGRVGIGTSSPSEALHVKSTSGTQLVLERDGTTTQIASVIFKDGSGDQNRISSSDSNLIFESGAGNTERLRIDSSGRVGIGTSSPGDLVTISDSTTPKLGLRTGTTQRGEFRATSAITSLVSYNSSPMSFIINDGTDKTAIHIDGSQRVGIGTATPATSLHLLGANTAARGQLSVAGNAADPRITLYRDSAFIGAMYGDTTNGVSIAAETGYSITFNPGGASEKARFDSSGRLLVGTSTSLPNSNGDLLQVATTSTTNVGVGKFENSGTGNIFSFYKSRNGTVGSHTVVQTDDEVASFRCYASSGSSYVEAARIGALIEAGTKSTASMPGRLVFSVTSDGASSPTERMRIKENGFTKISSSGSYYSESGTYHELRSNTNDGLIALLSHHGTSGQQYGLSVRTANDQNDTTRYFFQCTGGPTDRVTIRSNGGLANYQANDVNLSDINTKKDITPAAGTWDCVKEWEIVNYRYKDQPDDADLNLGVIAQQVAESCPEVITVFQEAQNAKPAVLDDEGNEVEAAQAARPERLGIKEQQMYWMAIKALQEAQVRIEALEAEVAALKAQ